MARDGERSPNEQTIIQWIMDGHYMTTAFERIRIVLKLKDPDDPLIEVVAKKVISLASQDTHDPKEIERLVIADTKRT